MLARLVDKVKEMGLYGLDTPPEYGGPEIDLVTRCLIAIECSQHRAGLYAPCYYAFGGARQAQLFEATDAQKEKYLYPMLRGEKKVFFGLSEPSGGSDPGRAIQTRAVRDGDHWVLNGTKLWISGADRADYGLVFARTGGPGRGGVTAFIVETEWEGFKVRRVVHTLRSAKYATEIQLEDLRVPHENILGEEGGGFAIANDRPHRCPVPGLCIGRPPLPPVDPLAVTPLRIFHQGLAQRVPYSVTTASRRDRLLRRLIREPETGFLRLRPQLVQITVLLSPFLQVGIKVKAFTYFLQGCRQLAG